MIGIVSASYVGLSVSFEISFKLQHQYRIVDV